MDIDGSALVVIIYNVDTHIDFAILANVITRIEFTILRSEIDITFFSCTSHENAYGSNSFRSFSIPSNHIWVGRTEVEKDIVMIIEAILDINFLTVLINCLGRSSK